METRVIAPQGMVVTSHHLASQSALAILREGGTGMEAVVAAAATISVVYPHMNGLGGDSFWLIIPPDGEPVAIEACGAAGSMATPEFFTGLDKIPNKGPKSAITVAGTVGGWQEALKYVTECGYNKVSISRLLADAIYYAEEGFPVSSSHRLSLEAIIERNEMSKDMADNFLSNSKLPKVGQKFSLPKLAKTLRHLSEHGLNSFYRGQLAKNIANDMKLVGMPITEADLAVYRAVRREPLRLLHKHGEVYNLPPPTQGLISLAILGILEKMNIDGKDESEFIHATVEATKKAFEMRDKYITDPRYMEVSPQSLIASDAIAKMAQNITDKASIYSKRHESSGTIWMGVMDNKGFSVSFIQSIYQDFGSGVVLPSTGILWHNRGVAFTLEDGKRAVEPGKKPFHTLNPAAAKLNDGRIMLYGTKGGDGQAQTQAAIFHRYVIQEFSLQKSVSSPRWLYGNEYAGSTEVLNLEDRFCEETLKELKSRGHNIKILDTFSESFGHAGILVRHPDGMLEGANDPRANGSAVGF